MSWFTFGIVCFPFILAALDIILIVMTAYIGRKQDREIEELRARIRKMEVLTRWEDADNEEP